MIKSKFIKNGDIVSYKPKSIPKLRKFDNGFFITYLFGHNHLNIEESHEFFLNRKETLLSIQFPFQEEGLFNRFIKKYFTIVMDTTDQLKISAYDAGEGTQITYYPKDFEFVLESVSGEIIVYFNILFDNTELYK